MRVSQDQILNAVNRYFEEELMMKAPNGIEKFKIAFMFGVYKNKIPKMIADYTNILKDTEMFVDGQYEADKVLQYGKEAIKKSGKIAIGGFMFDENDLQKLYNYL